VHDAGLSVTILEARDRIGGRIFTRKDSEFGSPIELGAEFIHGRPPETWKLLASQEVRIREVRGDTWCVEEGRASPCNFFGDVDKILRKMDDRKPDESFLDFLKYRLPKTLMEQERAVRWATGYVSGFNAADPALVGVHWLVREMRAEEKIEGERAFRSENGYADLMGIFQRRLKDRGIPVRTKSIVERVAWRAGHAEIFVRSSEGSCTCSAPQVLITVPLGVLQARADDAAAIEFRPELPPQKQNAIRGVMMGKVIRVILRFREQFWEGLPKSQEDGAPNSKGGGKSSRTEQQPKTMDGMSFLLSHDDWFPTWWTTAPEKLPFLVGWAPFHCAERLSGKSESYIVERALESLHRLLGVRITVLQSLLACVYLHDWQSDPFSRGAYSYGKAGEAAAQAALAQPVQNTLFFAGEATDVSGHTGTVHGAIATGMRAAAEIVQEHKRHAKKRAGKVP
jgi:monoamine oxidase